MHCRAAQKAFTLIEMLVSLAIVASIVTMVYGSYAATSRSLDVYGSRMACSERAHLALRMMARQIRCAYLPPTASHAPQTDVGRTIKPAEPAAAFYAEPAALRGNLLSFVTTGGFDLGFDRPLGISHVAYRYEDSQDALLICCEPFVQRTSTLKETGVWRPILTGLTEIELKFHDGKQWQTAWDSRRAGRLPHAVRIAIGVTDRQGSVQRYATTVPVACQSALRGQPTRAPGRQP